MKIKRKNRHFPNGLTASKTIIILYLIAGWNLVSFILNATESGTDRNVSLAVGQNLIAHSSMTDLALSSVKFINSTGGEFTWDEAVLAGKVQNYIAYFDSSPPIARDRRFKYVSTANGGLGDTSLREGKGYWITANEAGNITLPGVGGTIKGKTFPWRKLKILHGNGTMLNISAAGSVGWINSILQFWDASEGGFDTVCSNTEDCDTTSFSPWQGYYIKSLIDNATLIRQN